MPSRRALLSLAFLTVAAALAAATPAAADWLVIRDGSRVETKGAWEVRGAVVVFTLRNGTLGSVRTADADLDASQAATAEAARPAPAAPAATPALRKSVLTLTDADVAHVDNPPASTAASAGTETATASAATKADGVAPAPAATPPPATPAPEPERLKVTDWRQDMQASKEGATLVGQITNSSTDFVQNMVVTARLLDEEGKVIADANALLGAVALQPGQGTNFRVTFPGVFHFSSAKFELKSFAFKSAPAASGR